MKVDGSVALITGAGSGIGRAIAAALASAGDQTVGETSEICGLAEGAVFLVFVLVFGG